MAITRNGVQIPTVAAEYWQGYSSSSSPYFKKRRAFKTREEKFAEAEADFAEVYLREYDEDLPEENGIVVIQQGRYPMDFDVIFNPNVAHYCLKNLILFGDKIMRTPYVFASRTYMLVNGRIELLLEGEQALSLKYADKAVKKIYSGAVYEGECVMELFRGGRYPYRWWKIDDGYVIMSIANGAIFSMDELPQKEDMPEVLTVGEIRYRVEKGDFYRY